jgi:hypothetical protein
MTKPPAPHIPGYALGRPEMPGAPIRWQEFEELKKSVLFGDDDVAALRRSREILSARVEELLDIWYGFVGSHPHLVQAFVRKADGQPDEGYLAAVRKRFVQWVLDTASAEYDQAWLDYQFEIGRRHHRTGKNRTDKVEATEHIPLRHIIALAYPITFTLRPFLEGGGRSAEEVDRMYQAWLKSVILQVALWSEPYVKEGDY